MTSWLVLVVALSAIIAATFGAPAAPAQAGGCGLFRITAYWPGVGPHTADGTPTYGNEWSLVAVDPRVIPLQSSVSIEGLGTFRAADTGGGVYGNHVDVLMSSYQEAINWGSQSRQVCHSL